VIPPQVDRRDVHIPKISANDVEIGAFVGILSVQDFGAKPSAGLRLGYHVTEDFFLEGTYGRSTVSDQSYRRLGIAIFNSEEVPLTYYSLSVGWNLFPGEVFLGKNWAMTSAVYLVGGVGNVNFNSENHVTYNFGIGIRVLPVDWFSMRFEMRDQMFTSDLLGKNELKHNFEMTLGAAAYF
jgi:outer membrane beta-barrel protein